MSRNVMADLGLDINKAYVVISYTQYSCTAHLLYYTTPVIEGGL